MHNLLKKLFVSLCFLFPFSSNATPSIITTSVDLSVITGSSPYVLRFANNGTPAELTIDRSGTIVSIDLNASTTSVVVGAGMSALLGSVYDRQANAGIGAQTQITLDANSTLTLTGDDSWAAAVGNSTTGLSSNSFYYDTVGNEFLIIDSSGNAITDYTRSAIAEYLIVQLYGGATPSAGGASIYSGPYNIYSGVSSISLRSNTTFVVDTSQSSSGNKNAFATGGPTNNSPTILTNAFIFSNSSTTLNINTPLIAMHSSIGGFGSINALGSPALVINALDGPTTISSTWASTPQLFLLSDTTITHPSLGSNQIYIGNDIGTYPNSPTTTLKPSGATWLTASNSGASNFANNGLYISYVYPLGNSTLILDSSGAVTGSSVHFFSPYTGVGGWSFLEGGGGVIDLAGNVKLTTGNGNPLTIDAGSTGGALAGSLGIYDGYNTSLINIARLQSLTITGTEQIDVIMPVYSQRIIFDSNAPINLVQPGWVQNGSAMGDGAIITLLQDIVPGSSITVTGGDPTLQSTSATINLDTFTFNAGEATISTSDSTTQPFTSSLEFGGEVDINTSFVANQQSTGGMGGNFVVDGGDLDLSGANYISPTTVTVNFIADGTVPANGEFSYPLFTTSNNGQVILPSSGILFVPQITNPHPLLPMSWEYDPNTYIISSHTDRSQALGIVRGGGGSSGAEAIINNLVTPSPGSSSINTLQARALNNINSGTLAATVNNLEQLVLSSEVEDAIASVVAMHESESQSSIFVSIDSLMFAQEETIVSGEGAAAGSGSDNDIKHQHGLWTSGFLQKANQKSSGSVSGYEVLSYGGTLGVDTGVTDNLVLGFAWSIADSMLKRTDLKGNRSKIKTNLFSLYGLMGISQNWLIQSSLSGGFSRIESRAVRNIGVNPAVATGKHRSDYLGADIHFLRRVSFNNTDIVAEPDVGLNASQFNDNAYSEMGGGTNWEVGKRKSYNIEAIIGGRLLRSCKTRNDYLLKPYLSAYSHITLKDRRGKIHISLDSKMDGVHLAQPKASAVWYSGGAGLDIYKDNIEVSTSWELQLDKGYVSNQGSIKFRVEF